MSTTPTIVELEIAQLHDLLQRAAAKALRDEDYETIKVLTESYVTLVQLVGAKSTTIARLRKMLFGAPTEKTDAVLGSASDPSHSPAAEGPTGNPSTDKGLSEAGKPPTGHGRNGADAYTGAETIDVPHASLQAGDPCPDCGRGTVYEMRRGAVLVRIVGQAPVQAKVYRLRKLRCHLCGKIFTAAAPEGVGAEKYDATVGSMIALLKYGSGMPFNRLEGLQGNLGIPLPASTQWDIVRNQAKRLQPVFDELCRQGAQGDVVYNDDTPARILEWMGKRGRARLLAETSDETSAESSGETSDKTSDESSGKTSGKTAKARSGLFTSGIVSTREGRRIVLFFSGRQHAGENLHDVLSQRAQALSPPIQMCDALSRNLPGELATIVANCLAHGRRQFVDVAEHFPEAAGHVLEALKVIYRNDAIAQKQNLSPEARLQFHQAQSGPTMEELKVWLARQFDQRLVEPNSALGGAIKYLQRHWEKLTLFLRVPGAPLDNNLRERALKKVILHRKNALFYKTHHGARVGDLYMSLIHTCELGGVNPFDYLAELTRHPDQVAADPPQWMPWTYRQTLTTLPPLLRPAP